MALKTLGTDPDHRQTPLSSLQIVLIEVTDGQLIIVRTVMLVAKTAKNAEIRIIFKSLQKDKSTNEAKTRRQQRR